jgi:hypothetical protein
VYPLKHKIVFGGVMRRLVYPFIIIIMLSIPAMAQVDTAWIRTYDMNPGGSGSGMPMSVDVDTAGNIFVAGWRSYSPGGIDIVTLKYYPNGDTAWSRYYSSWGSYTDHPSVVKADNQGNVYMAGTSADGASRYYYILIKYLPNGDTAWTRLYHDFPAPDYGPFISIGESGNIYLAGYITVSEMNTDLLLIKYAPNGDTIWRRIYGSPSQAADGATAIALDSSENIYLTGFTSDSDHQWSDILTVKYDSSGTRIWTAQYNGALDYTDMGYYVAVDNDENIYVAGDSREVNGYDDMVLIKYSADGDSLWHRYYNDEVNRDDKVRGLAVDNSNNVIMTGYSSVAFGNMITIKYDPAGNLIWQRAYFPFEMYNSSPTSICLDSFGNIYITGLALQSLTALKYYPNGDTAWTWGYGYSRWGTGIALDNQSNVIITGYDSYYAIKLVQEPQDVDDGNNPLPSKYNLHPAYPNPFNAQTIISYDLPKEANVNLEIYDLLGRRVATLAEGTQEAGTHQVVWDGSGVSSGLYFYRLKAGDYSDIKKMTMLK